MKKIYVSGKITGLSHDEYMVRFAAAENRLIEAGYSVINPAKVNSNMPEDTTYQQYMDMSKTMLGMCDTIYMLSNWKESNGANLEFQWAKERGMHVLYEDREETENGEAE